MPKQRPKYLALDGVTEYPSVTTITGGAVNPDPLIGWAHSQGLKGATRADMRKASDIGNIVHDAAEDYINGNEVSDVLRATWPKEAEYAYNAWRNWLPDCGLKFIASEIQMVHDEIGYGGTFDALAWDDEGKLVLVDWKTSKRCYPEMVAQLAAYAQLLHKGRGNVPNVVVPEIGTMPDYALIVRLPKVPNCSAVAVELPGGVLADGIDQFTGALAVHRARLRIDKFLHPKKGRKRKGKATSRPPMPVQSKVIGPDGYEVVGHCHWCHGAVCAQAA